MVNTDGAQWAKLVGDLPALSKYIVLEIMDFITYRCISGLKKNAIPAAHLYHALYRELTHSPPCRIAIYDEV